MSRFPCFMTPPQPDPRRAAEHRRDRGVFFQGDDGGQMAFWEAQDYPPTTISTTRF